MVPALTQPTRSYIDGTPTQRRLGFVAASIFSATYVIAPVYLLLTGVTLVRAKRPLSKDVWLLTLPLIASAMLPAKLLPKFGRWLLQTKFMSCVPYYFDYEEFHEITVLTQRLILNLNLMTACRRDPHDVASMARGWDLHHLHAIAATWHRIDGVFMIT